MRDKTIAKLDVTCQQKLLTESNLVSELAEELQLRTGSQPMISHAHTQHESPQSSHISTPGQAAEDTAAVPAYNTNRHQPNDDYRQMICCHC